MKRPHPAYAHILPERRIDEEETPLDDVRADVVCTDLDVALGVVPPLGSRYDAAGKCWRR